MTRVPSISYSRQQMQLRKQLLHRRATPEQDQQVRLFKLIAENLEQFPDLAWIWAIPNGGHRHKKTAGLLKAQGVKAGIWDIFCAPSPDNRSVPGMWIEMKAGKNGLSGPQIAFRDAMLPRGYVMQVCYSAEAAAAAIEAFYGIELKRSNLWQQQLEIRAGRNV